MRALKYSKKGFTLRSGRVSGTLIDASRAIKEGSTFIYVGQLCRDFLMSLPGEQLPRAVGGPSTGSDPLCASVLASMPHSGINWFSIRKEPKNRGLDHGCASGCFESGWRVVLFEDVLTTGGSLLHAIRETQLRGMEIVGVYVLVDREEGGLQVIRDELRGVPVHAEFTKTEIEIYRQRLGGWTKPS